MNKLRKHAWPVLVGLVCGFASSCYGFPCAALLVGSMFASYCLGRNDEQRHMLKYVKELEHTMSGSAFYVMFRAQKSQSLEHVPRA